VFRTLLVLPLIKDNLPTVDKTWTGSKSVLSLEVPLYFREGTIHDQVGRCPPCHPLSGTLTGNTVTLLMQRQNAALMTLVQQDWVPWNIKSHNTSEMLTFSFPWLLCSQKIALNGVLL